MGVSWWGGRKVTSVSVARLFPLCVCTSARKATTPLRKAGEGGGPENTLLTTHCFGPFLPYIAVLASQAHTDPELGFRPTGWLLGTVLYSHFLHLALLLLKTGFQYVLP